MTNNRLVNSILLIFILLVLGYIITLIYPLLRSTNLTQPKKRSVLSKVNVRQKWLNQAGYAGFYVAKDKGFYEENGLDVDVREYEFGGDQTTDIVSGNFQFVVDSAPEFLKAVSRGNDIIAVAVIYQKSPYAFASLKKKNINTPADLRGKILGTTGGGSFEAIITYQALLAYGGVKESDVTYKDLAFDEVGNLRDNRADLLDLYRTNEVYKLNKAGLDINLLLPEEYGFQMYGDVIVTTKQFAGENPEVVQNFIKATVKGWEYAIKNQEEAVEITMSRVNKEYDDIDYQRFILSNAAPLIKPTGQTQIGLMENSVWMRAYNAMAKATLLDEKFNVVQYFTNEYLQ
ncbi:ABC transporter substrate-binding protein [Candidatus Gottesmanbacteria bacterium]|nr:ABC transporter substrate-binding protein [Candidatus Gottesmanbacteria bacterium]